MIAATFKISPNKNVLKKLTDKKRWDEFVDLLLQNIGNEAIREIRTRASGAFANSKGGYLASVKKEVNDGVLRVWAEVPYARLIEYGAPERPMTWLIKPYPISFKLKNGTKIQGMFVRRILETLPTISLASLGLILKSRASLYLLRHSKVLLNLHSRSLELTS